MCSRLPSVTKCSWVQRPSNKDAFFENVTMTYLPPKSQACSIRISPIDEGAVKDWLKCDEMNAISSSMHTV